MNPAVVWSEEALAASFKSGEMHTAFTTSLWLSKECLSYPLERFQILTDLSYEAVSISLPSELIHKSMIGAEWPSCT